jgi:XTP/dITP diphosphohydrolase
MVLTRPTVLASRNAHKVAEVKRILAKSGLDIELVGLDELGRDVPDVAETGATFAENALIKAQAVFGATGLATIADDSGLCVDALNGMPGVLSARWSGGHGDDSANLDLVLDQIADVPPERRGARFMAAVACVCPGADPVVVHGAVDGSLLFERRGEGGFGYDPIFVPTGYDRTTAELPPEQKDALSHRGNALRELAAKLR